MKYLTADIEANNWIDFLLIGLYDGERTLYYEFDNIDSWIDCIESYQGYRIYFHNGGRYDFLFLIEKLLDRYKLEFVNAQSSFIAIKITELNIDIVDSYKLLPAGLEKLIDFYNIVYKKIPIDFSKKLTTKNKRLKEHLRNDCMALYDVLSEVIAQYGELKYTIASQALHIFTKKFFKGTIYQVTNNHDLYFRGNYYRGGRTEVYKGYGKNLNYYDINSLYPYVMMKPMPVLYPIETKKYINNKIGFYKIRLLTNTDYIISPLNIKIKDGLYHVNGNKGDIFYLCSPELEYLYETGNKFEVISGIYFDKKETIFNRFIDHFYEIKMSTENESERYFAKLMLNSLYGKFGQKLNGEQIVHGYQNGAKVYDAENDLFLIDVERKIKFKGVHIAAYITSLARLELLKRMREAGEEHIWYADTDSIVTDKKLRTGVNIGDLKIVSQINEAVFISPKTYSFIDEDSNEIVKHKGFTSDSFTHSDFKKLLFGDVLQLEKKSKRILGFKESVKRKNDILIDNGKYLKLVEQVKILKSNYKRRVIIPDKKFGFKTIPLRLNELTTNQKEK